MSSDSISNSWQQQFAILNCRVTFNCPKSWHELSPTIDAAIRNCSTCEQNVFRCRNPDEMKSHVKAGHCVAVFSDEDEKPGFIGQIKSDYYPRDKLPW